MKVRAKVLKTKGRKADCALDDGDAIGAQAVHNRTTPEVDADEPDVEKTDLEETEVEEAEDF